MDERIVEIAERIRTLREVLEYSVEEAAEATGVTTEEYLALENGETDFSFTFLHKCALLFCVDIVELLTGENPRLSFFSVTRAGTGPSISRRAGFAYEYMAANLKAKRAEPFIVTAPFKPEEQEQEIFLSTHKGQEFDYILSGSLKVRLEDHILILNAGDCIMYDSSHGHGMIATGGEDCRFLAMVIPE